MSDPAPALRVARPASNLRARVVSALVMAPVVVGATLVGGPLFAAIAAVGAVLVLWEWLGMLPPRRLRRCAGLGALSLLVATLVWQTAGPAWALAVIAGGALGAGALASLRMRAWTAAGVLYASALLVPALVLRGDPEAGLAAILFLFAAVWATDIAAYFVGRAVGGPKLAPRISPNKTWSGAIGGALAGTLAGFAVAVTFGVSASAPLVAVSLAVAIIAQTGDLFESWFKRRRGVKDSGRLIPGHGGLMDRVDGLIAAAAFLALVGVVRGGPSAAATGALAW